MNRYEKYLELKEAADLERRQITRAQEDERRMRDREVDARNIRAAREANWPIIWDYARNF